LHIKLDELIRVSKGANQELLNLESMDPAHLEEIRQRYEALARTAADIKSKKERCMPDSRSASSEPSDKVAAESGNVS
ncbi:low affinity iron permease family protein, partial [Enterobacter hormaechei]|uniref:low affinity iron permease family protein n=1 Tax=Enterobacter hormaechei TaxID=158836 RepID=UPI0019541AB6